MQEEKKRVDTHGTLPDHQQSRGCLGVGREWLLGMGVPALCEPNDVAATAISTPRVDGIQPTLEVALWEQEGAPVSTMEPKARGRDMIRKALSRRAAKDGDAPALAEAAVNICRDVAPRLAVVLGEKGVDVVFRRSVHLSSAHFPWLAIGGEDGTADVVLARLGEVLARQEKQVAAEASYILLVTLTELLATLIGESLTETLLSPIWVPASPRAHQESVP